MTGVIEMVLRGKKRFSKPKKMYGVHQMLVKGGYFRTVPNIIETTTHDFHNILDMFEFENVSIDAGPSQFGFFPTRREAEAYRARCVEDTIFMKEEGIDQRDEALENLYQDIDEEDEDDDDDEDS